MKNQITTIALGVGIALSTFAVPGFSTQITSFALNSSITGAVTLDNSGNVTNVTGVVFNTFIAGGPPASFATTLNRTQAGNGTTIPEVLTVTANQAFGTANGINYTNIAAGETLLTITLNNAVTSLKDANALGSNALLINWTSALVSSIVVDPHLLADFGWGNVTPTAAFSGGALTGPSPTTAGPNNLNSNTMTLSLTATPEPASLFLFGSGLLVAGLFGRRKLTQRGR